MFNCFSIFILYNIRLSLWPFLFVFLLLPGNFLLPPMHAQSLQCPGHMQSAPVLLPWRSTQPPPLPVQLLLWCVRWSVTDRRGSCLLRASRGLLGRVAGCAGVFLCEVAAIAIFLIPYFSASFLKTNFYFAVSPFPKSRRIKPRQLRFMKTMTGTNFIP